MFTDTHRINNGVGVKPLSNFTPVLLLLDFTAEVNCIELALAWTGTNEAVDPPRFPVGVGRSPLFLFFF